MGDLNREQRAASRADSGVNIVLAGAGTGKTKTLVEKVRSVVAGLPLAPEQILILTFSRRAAEELRDRVAAGLGDTGSGISAWTFHSFCLDLLRHHRDVFMEKYGFTRFPDVLDDDGRGKVIDGLVRRDLGRFKGLPAGVVRDLLGRIEYLDDWTTMKIDASGIMEELRGLALEYASLKRERNLADYDDMIRFTIGLLGSDPAVREQVLLRHRYVFVDEFQDVADDNFRLLELLLPGAGGNLFAVGDDWQSIYGFRRANVAYIVKARHFFPAATVHRLTINYRSRGEIVVLSNRFIRRNRFRTRKRPRSGRGRGGTVRFHVAPSFREEASLVADIIGRSETRGTMAVLYRNNWQGRYLESVIGPVPIGGRPVSFMTMHASKGLEFDEVIIAGVSDQVIPDRENDIEEERRLLYVGMTRARESLHVIAHHDEHGTVGRFGRELGIRVKNN